MNLAVLLYRDVSNPLNIPADWPAIAEPFNNQPPPYIEMTPIEYANYLAAHKAEYDVWLNAHVYLKSYLNLRYAAYPPIEDHLTAIVEMALALYPVPGTLPPLMQQIVDKRNIVNQQYPTPP